MRAVDRAVLAAYDPRDGRGRLVDKIQNVSITQPNLAFTPMAKYKKGRKDRMNSVVELSNVRLLLQGLTS